MHVAPIGRLLVQQLGMQMLLVHNIHAFTQHSNLIVAVMGRLKSRTYKPQPSKYEDKVLFSLSLAFDGRYKGLKVDRR